jgi:hypothetical protein
MKVEYTKCFEWAVPPKQNLQSQPHLDCILIINPRPITLKPNIITPVQLGYKVKIPDGYVFQVKDHLPNKPWRVTSEFVWSGMNVHPMIIPLVTSKETFLKKDEIIAHLQVQPISLALNTLLNTSDNDSGINIKFDICNNKNNSDSDSDSDNDSVNDSDSDNDSGYDCNGDNKIEINFKDCVFHVVTKFH